AHHRQGYATDALRTVIEYLRTQGHHRVTIDPSVDNSAAIACSRNVGFEPVGVMRAYERQSDRSWTDGLLMDLII
ncbi:MAG: GNAT family N-acetyltransferase, partial [Acidimicrobiia bacterium]|nr:GNAT family N-acetyltransferase [Acidimicrobiia bacterium]